jgi:small conductance mechanosensitive channel
LGAVIGFGAQSVIRDFISGAFIIIENQFRVGDDVEVDGAIGKVEHITLRSTVIRDDAGNVHYIANGNVFHVINKTMGYSKVYFALSVAPETDIDELRAVIDNIGLKLASDEKWKKKIIEPVSLFNLGAFSDQALEVRVSGKTQPGDQFAVTTEFKKRLLAQIKKQKDIKLSQYQDISTLAKK